MESIAGEYGLLLVYRESTEKVILKEKECEAMLNSHFQFLYI